MKTRLQLLLLSSFAPKGFALPTVLIIGVVITTLGLAVALRSQKDLGNSVAQANTAKASNLTEAGVNQYLSFLNNNRLLLTFPSCVSAPNADGSCPDNNATTQRSWSTVNLTGSTVLAVASPSADSTCPSTEVSEQANQTSAADIATVWANSSNSTGWRDIGQGQFRLVSYAYTATGSPNTAPGTGTLILEGRVNQRGSGNSATDDASRTARSRIAVSFPVTVGPSPSPSPGNNFPAVWARSFSFNGTADIYGNVWDSSNCMTGGAAMPSARVKNVPSNPIVVVRATNNGNNPQYQLSGTLGQNVVKRLAFPPLPNNNVYPTTNPGVTVNSISCPYDPGDVTFPRAGDRDMNGNIYNSGAPANATYIYRVCGNNSASAMTVKQDTVTLGRSGQERFIFYVDGDLVTESNGHITPTGTTRTRFYIGPSGHLDVGANGNKGIAGRPTALQFYVYAQDTSSSVKSVKASGNGALYAFIFAPFANAEMWGTGDTAGAVWAKTYSGGGNGSVLQGIFDPTELDVSLNTTPVPQVGAINSWQQQPVP